MNTFVAAICLSFLTQSVEYKEKVFENAFDSLNSFTFGWENSTADPAGVFSPDGKLYAYGRDGIVHIVETTTFNTLTELASGGNCVMQVAFTPNGRYISAYRTTNDGADLKEIIRRRNAGEKFVKKSAISIWDTKTWKLHGRAKDYNEGWPKVADIGVGGWYHLVLDSGTLLTSNPGLHIWTKPYERPTNIIGPLKDWEFHINAASQNGKYCAATVCLPSKTFQVKIYEVATGAEVRSFPATVHQENRGTATFVTENSIAIDRVSDSRRIDVWNIETGTLVRRISFDDSSNHVSLKGSNAIVQKWNDVKGGVDVAGFECYRIDLATGAKETIRLGDFEIPRGFPISLSADNALVSCMVFRGGTNKTQDDERPASRVVLRRVKPKE